MPPAKDYDMMPHTAAKHAILRRYLECWFPILGRWHSVAYVDGFAGPGRYSKGEEGSPIIALKAAADRTNAENDVHFWFVESSPSVAASLQGEIAGIRGSLPGNLRIHDVVQKDFESGFREIVARLKSDYDMPPTFAFVDPFGYSDTTMRTFVDFLANQHCEIFFTFMAPSVARFTRLQRERHSETLNALFGCEDWKDCDDKHGRKKIECLVRLYAAQLGRHKVRHVKIFEMLDKNQYPEYSLVFATNHIKGLEVMKDAMSKVARDFSFSFSDARDPKQRSMFPSDEEDGWQPDAARIVHDHFRGKTAMIHEVREYVIAKTKYRFKAGILNTLEDSVPPKITVSHPEKKRRRHTYPEGTLVAFAP